MSLVDNDMYKFSFSFEVLFTIMKKHFEIINNIYNKSNENEKLLELISQSSGDYFKSKMITQPEFIKTQLFTYQKANIYWMIERESNNLPINLSNDMTMNWGPIMEINISKKQIYEKNKNHIYTNHIKGGCLCDDVGLGKSLQILTLCLYNNGSTLILTPSHLINHWKDEYEKHVVSNHDVKVYICTDLDSCLYINDILLHRNVIIICSFDLLNSEILTNFNFSRIVIDEYHEIALEKADQLGKLNSDYKWVVTATPFINSDMIFNIINFTAKNKITNKKIVKYKKYIDSFSDIFRKNTKKNVERELVLPKIKEIKYYLNFSEKEKLFYDSIVPCSYSVVAQKKFCINPSLFFKNDINDSFVSLDKLDDSIKKYHNEELDKKQIQITEYRQNILSKVIKSYTMISNLNNGELFKSVGELWECAISQKLVPDDKIKYDTEMILKLEKIKSTIKYFNSQLDLLNNSNTKSQSELYEFDCGICLCNLDAKYTFLYCGHVFCYECIKLVMTTNLTKCPMCKLNLTNTVNYIIGNVQDNKNHIGKYGTKITQLIRICEGKKEKIILYSHTPQLLVNVVKILLDSDIKSKLFDSVEYCDFETDDTQVLVLSSLSNASGLNFQFVKTVILLEPLDGDYIYRKQIENQIIGRLHRIGQTNEIEFIRLIMLNSIESQIDVTNKINDAIYINNSDDMSHLTITQEITV